MSVLWVTALCDQRKGVELAPYPGLDHRKMKWAHRAAGSSTVGPRGLL